MLTNWRGYGVAADNVVAPDVFFPKLLRVTLGDAGLVTQVTLSTTTHAVNMFTNMEPVWYALDEDPGPLSQPTLDMFVPVTAWRPGGILQPGGWQQTVVDLDGNAHVLHLVCETAYVTVALVMLEERQ